MESLLGDQLMFTLSLKGSNKGNVWFNADVPFLHEVETIQELHLNSEGKEEHISFSIAIELSLWRGSRSIYGLLGASFISTPNMSFQVRILISEQNTDIPDKVVFLANPPEVVQIGLPNEYANSIAAMCENFNQGKHRLPSGQLSFNCAAHGIIASNSWIFNVLTEAILDTVIQSSAGQTEQEIIEKLMVKLNAL
jgi:hypothetical protein